MTAKAQVELWLAREPVDYDDGFVAAWQGRISAGERKRMQRFVQPADQRRFLLGRALMRSVLADRLGLAPEVLTFCQGVYGKPALEGGGPQFNLSHTRGLVVLAVSESGDVGVDVERVDRELALLELARRYFSPGELEAITALDGAAQREYFFAVWTLKEAWLKARGLGLRVPLDAFTFRCDSDTDGVSELDCASVPGERAANWSFERRAVDGFRLALACWNPQQQPLLVSVRDAGFGGADGSGFR